MNHSPEFSFELVKLRDGSRAMRVLDSPTGTCLERILNPDLPLTKQKLVLQHALTSLLQRELKETVA